MRQTEQSSDRAIVFADWHLNNGHPSLRPVRPVDQFFLTDNRFAGLNNLLLVAFDPSGVDLTKEFRSGSSDGILGRIQPEPISHRPVDPQVMPVAVFEEDIVRNVLHQAGQQKLFAPQCRFRFVASGNVPEDSLDTDDVVSCVVNRSLQHVHVKRASVSTGVRLDVFVSFTTFDNPSIVCRVLICQRFGKQVVVG